MKEKTVMSVDLPKNVDYSQYLQINPEVQQVADVEVVKQDYVVELFKPVYVEVSTSSFYMFVDPYGSHGYIPSAGESAFYVRFCIKVTPKNGAPESLIVKTFKLDDDWTYIGDR